MRLESDSGKACNPDFSTFAQITCGERWTTQRFIAFDRIVRANRAGRWPSGLNFAAERHEVQRANRVYESIATPQDSHAALSFPLAIPLCEQFEPQRVELDETLSIVLVVGSGIVFKRDMRLRIERMRRFASDDTGQTLVEL